MLSLLSSFKERRLPCRSRFARSAQWRTARGLRRGRCSHGGRRSCLRTRPSDRATTPVQPMASARRLASTTPRTRRCAGWPRASPILKNWAYVSVRTDAGSTERQCPPAKKCHRLQGDVQPEAAEVRLLVKRDVLITHRDGRVCQQVPVQRLGNGLVTLVVRQGIRHALRARQQTRPCNYSQRLL